MDQGQDLMHKNKEISSEAKPVKSSDEVLQQLNIQPVEKLVLIDQIIDRIGTLLADGVLKSGDALPSERTLSEMLKVSRTSVRQALKALDVLGVLEIRPGSRTYLSKSIKQLLVNPMKFMLLLYNVTAAELFETRKTIEVELTKLAAKNATKDDIEAMKNTLDKAGSHLDEPREYLSSEMAFHDAIIKAARNRVMEAMMASINNLLLESREKTVLLFTDLNESLQQHIKIFEAIKKGDAKTAQQAMFDHLNKVEKMMVEVDEDFSMSKEI
jgi:GntR family transcriptional repressor for pyruvate dehydrogenase complex